MFVKVNKENYIYNGRLNKYDLHVELCECSCSYFIKYAVCIHLAAFSNFFGKKWFNDKYNDKVKVFDYKTKRGAKAKKYKKAEKALKKTFKFDSDLSFFQLKLFGDFIFIIFFLFRFVLIICKIN